MPGWPGMLSWRSENGPLALVWGFFDFVDKEGGVADKESEHIMPRTHRPYDAAFRQQAVDLALTSGKPYRDVARDLGDLPSKTWALRAECWIVV